MQSERRREPLKPERVIQLVIFHIRDEEFGVPIDDIQEIIKAGLITPIPDTPKYIKGIINVRGEIVTTIDMKVRFSIAGTDINAPRHIVITKQRDSLFGLMVDEVTEVLRIEEKEIKPPPRLISELERDYVKGVIVYDKRLLILLDLSKVLSKQELDKVFEISKEYPEKRGPMAVNTLQESSSEKFEEEKSVLSKKSLKDEGHKEGQ